MARTEERIFDGGHIRASLFNPDAPRLIVTFRQRVNDPGTFSDAQPVRSFISRDHAHLHLQSLRNDWYINPDTLALADVLRALTARYRRVSAIGFSMGGYAALRFSRPLRLRQLIAVSPQFTISPRVLPGDARYRDCAGGFDDALGSLGATARRSLEGVILCDPFKRLDLVNAEMIQTVFPNLHICRLGGGGHPASRVLRQGGHFGDLQKLLLSGDVNPARIIGLHRSSRRESEHYWSHIVRVAARNKRPELARFATKQVDNLTTDAPAGRNPPDAS